MLDGHLLNERYKIRQTIGGGGMANVYLARDIILERDVAIKVLRIEYANDEEFIARFDREAQSATSLSHPNIVNIYDVGEEDNILFMVMEYIDGMTLKEYIQQYGPLEVSEALDIMKQITSAIAHAHANDIVHRDIKPQNILIDSDGQVKVTDFGIAMALSATALTQTNSVLGSVHYLSPEQARGGMATKKSDIYSLGIVLFELLTGRLPFSGESAVSIALKHLQDETPSVRQINDKVPQSVENIVLKATAKNPFHRFDNVYDMEETIHTALHPDRIDESKYTPPVEEGEETKAIPVITDKTINDNDNKDEDTITQHSNQETKSYENKEEGATEPSSKKKKKRRKKWVWIIAIIVLLMGSGIAALFIIPSLMQPEDVTIPDIIGMEFDEAQEELEQINIEAEEELVFSDEVEEGFVVRTSPQVGRTVKEGSIITVFVSQGKETETFGDYVGEEFNQVQQILEEQGFEEIIGYEKTSEEPEGIIINQTQPEPNAEVIPGETRVIFEVSSGPDPIALSNLEGMSQEEAENILEEQGLNINVIKEHSDDVAEGNVIRQNPAPNTNLEEGETVDVYVSIGIEELPPRTHTEEFVVEYDPPPTDEEETEEPVEQTVRIYIGDMNYQIDEVYHEETITADETFTITLTIEQDTSAEYRVMLDDDVVIQEEISYEDGE
ncbi:Stk1 family PASTA domain-containing Ser/Thr kinase [Oceanobacillus halotolerans]|uniref:Stk1 family PASTA domain-containing Ser/Thr kinase n=1 Tax=Oceanobacillus halotolerans TaxID=2663380 RepID=UPI0013DA5138|nr:Stk1 family PASTA domain-containing Ser/Thr kinase [Oceanobacillus halotolerans]